MFLLVDSANGGPFSVYSKNWPLYQIQPGLVLLVNYVSAGPLVKAAVLSPLVDPATTGPISESAFCDEKGWS